MKLINSSPKQPMVPVQTQETGLHPSRSCVWAAAGNAGWRAHSQGFVGQRLCHHPKQSKGLFWRLRCFGEMPSPHSSTWAVFPSLFQAMTLDGADLTTEVFYKSGHDYQFLCHGKDQTGQGCHNYRVRFLCGKSGMCPTSESQRTAAILSSHDWLLQGVRTTSVIFPSQIFGWAMDMNLDRMAEDLSQE